MIEPNEMETKTHEMSISQDQIRYKVEHYYEINDIQSKYK